jgi:hypothetical protein
MHISSNIHLYSHLNERPPYRPLYPKVEVKIKV